jgi:hypothetical protein
MTKQTVQFEDNATIPTSGLREYVIGFAQQHGVTYIKTPHDELAEVITRLSDDDVEMDDVRCLLIALNRAGVMSTKRMGQILVNYLLEKFHVHPD